jgi:hypothetical protein
MIRYLGAGILACGLLSTPAFAQHHHSGGANWAEPFVGGYNYPYYYQPYYTPPPTYTAPPTYYAPQPRWCRDYYGRWYQC